jgi:E3 ubiquitin-protein ligase UBR1
MVSFHHLLLPKRCSGTTRVAYAFTLLFRRHAAILISSSCSVPDAVLALGIEQTEYCRLIGVSPLSDHINQDTVQIALSRWCVHYDHSQVASQLNCGVAQYRSLALEDLFAVPNSTALMCQQRRTVPSDAASLICGTMCCM